MATINAWANTISSAAVTLNGGAVNIGTDNAANTITVGAGTTARTINVGNSAAAHVVTVGSTTGAASLALKYGTADFTLASATGTVMSALDTGEITMPLQPLFSAYKSSATSNVTGDATAYQVVFDTEISDPGADYNNATGVFTAPVTGKYLLSTTVMGTGIGVQTTAQTRIVTTSYNIEGNYVNPTTCKDAGNNLGIHTSMVISMTAGDTALVQAIYSGSTKTVGVNGNSPTLFTNFSGCLIA